ATPDSFFNSPIFRVMRGERPDYGLLYSQQSGVLRQGYERSIRVGPIFPADANRKWEPRAARDGTPARSSPGPRTPPSNARPRSAPEAAAEETDASYVPV